MRNVVLIGFMGTGKTSIGKMLATRLGFSFVDLDQYIEQKEGRSIPSIFQEQGEAAFRAMEHEAVLENAKRRNTVIATGGGTVKDASNMEALHATGAIVCLKADVDTILERTAREGERPVLDKEDQGERRQAIEKLLEERKELYTVADFSVNTADLSPLQVVDTIAQQLKRRGVLHG